MILSLKLFDKLAWEAHLQARPWAGCRGPAGTLSQPCPEAQRHGRACLRARCALTEAEQGTGQESTWGAGPGSPSRKGAPGWKDWQMKRHADKTAWCPLGMWGVWVSLECRANGRQWWGHGPSFQRTLLPGLSLAGRGIQGRVYAGVL